MPGLVPLLQAVGTGLRRIPEALSWAPALAWMGLITSLSSIPSPGRPASVGWAFVSNLGHAPLYGILSLWLVLLVPDRASAPALGPRERLGILCAVLALGLLDELHQHYLTSGRDLSLLDVVTDLTGAFHTLLVVAYLGRSPSDGAREGGLALRLALGVLACCAAAAAATWLPRRWPHVPWI